MADKKKGFIPLWRDIQDHWLWKRSEPFDYRSAWIDILLSVNHEERKICINGRVQIIKTGQMWTSVSTLCDRWHWSKPKCYRFINLLKSDGMIYTDGNTSGTLLTVMNYSNFALVRNTDVTTSVTPSVTSPVTSTVTPSVTQTITKDNDNNEEQLRKRDPAPPNDGGEWQ